MSITGILSNGVTALMANSAALRVTSENIANVNTPGYVRRVAHMQTLAPGGVLSGVELSQVERVINNYLDMEVLNARSQAARYDIQASILDQFDATLGQPGDGASLGSRLDAVYAALGQASLDPATLSTRLNALNQFQSLTQTVSGLADAIDDLRVSADQQISDTVSQINQLIEQIYELNPQIFHATLTGNGATGLLDQRDLLVGQLAELVDIRTSPQSDGRLFISTTDGVQLVSDIHARLVYQAGSSPSFNPVMAESINPKTGDVIGTPVVFDSHASSGKLRGLLDMRDNVLVDFGEELGTLAQTLSLALNAQHNASSAFPPPGELNGRQTGLLSTDALNFSGATTIGITDANGVLLHRIDIDFDTGNILLDGAGAGSTGATIGSFVAALNAALGANGSADFTDGVLTLSGAGLNGLVISDDASDPSSRGGLGFSQFFGLNDLVRADGNSIQTTGLSATDTHGLAPGGSMTVLLKGPDGRRVDEVSLPVTGTTIGDMVGALNTAFTGSATFALDGNGQLTMTPAAGLEDYNFEVGLDTTQRGTTGQSFSSLFGIGTGEGMARARSLRINPDVAGSAQRLSFAQPTLSATTPLGSAVLTPGDNRGLLALQDAFNQVQSFQQSGALPARMATLTDYAASFYQDISGRSSRIDADSDAQHTRLTFAQKSQSSVEGVNLDEELERMMVLQQAYNASARLIRLAEELYDELLSTVGR